MPKTHTETYTAHAEDRQHQRIVQRLARQMVKRGCPPAQVSISGIQNPDLEIWAKKKGITFDKKQKVDLLFPEGYEEDN